MQKTNALQLRQSLGKVINRLLKTGEPILLEKDRKPVAVIISLEEYQKRFVDYEADKKREEMVERIRKAQIPLPEGTTSLDLIRNIRSK